MKKRIGLLLLAFAAFLMQGCFETTEELTVTENGSGTYRYAMDLKGLFDMIETMKAMDTTGNAGMGFPKERKDTTINFRSFTDTATALTAAQKDLYRNATLHLLMDEKAKEFNVTMNMPFTKESDVEKLAKLLSSEEGSGVLSKLFKQNKAFGDEASSGDGGKLPDLNSYYDLAVTKNIIERKLNKAKYDSVMQQYGNQFSAGGMDDMLENIRLNTVVHLPRAVKKLTGTKATASADKKTITVKGSLADLFKSPEVFSYRVEY